MKAIVSYDEVTQVLTPNDIAYDMSIESWSQDVQAIVIVDSKLQPFVKQGLLYDIKNNFYDKTDLLRVIQEKRCGEVVLALGHLDTMAARPAQYITLAMAVAEQAPADDVDRLWQYEEIKEENRKLLAQLNAATTWEEAEAIKPWMPWEAPTLSPNLHSSAVQNLYGIDNARLPS